MKKNSNLDMTEGSPYRLILSFGLPVMLGIIFQEFYHVADSAIVGKILGGSALAAVGATGSINTLIIGGCTGICSGLSIPVAQQIGAPLWIEAVVDVAVGIQVGVKGLAGAGGCEFHVAGYQDFGTERKSMWCSAA